MKGPTSARSVGVATIRVAMFAAMLMLAAGTSYAERGNGRSQGDGQRTRQGDGQGKVRAGGGQSQRGADRTYGSGVRRYKDADVRTRGGGGGAPAYRGGGERGSRGGRGDVRRGDGYTRWGHGGGTVGRGRVYGAPRYYGGGPVYRRPVAYRYPRPRSYVSFGIGLGLPYYCPTSYRYYVAPRPVVRSYRPVIEVDNLPPGGCYYYDPYCESQFPDLDSYTDHIDREGHPNTIEIVDRETGEWVRTLEFVGGYWEVKR